MLIKTKAEMYELYERGLFGNKPLTWDLESYYRSTYPKNVVMRYKGAMGGQWCQYNISRTEVPEYVAKWVAEGANPNLIALNEALHDDKLLIQGEVMLDVTHYSLLYSTVPKPMRLALREKSQTAVGLEAVMILKHYLDPASYDDLQALFELYPTAVVEFSTWSIDTGCIPNRNTIFWEVRNY